MSNRLIVGRKGARFGEAQSNQLPVSAALVQTSSLAAIRRASSVVTLRVVISSEVWPAFCCTTSSGALAASAWEIWVWRSQCVLAAPQPARRHADRRWPPIRQPR